MEPELFKLLSTFGGAGLVGIILWMISKRYMDAHASQVATTQQVQEKRIDALEKAQTECEQDRRRMHDEIVALLKERTAGAKA